MKSTFYKGDIRDRAFVDSVLDKEKIDAVIHFAANSLVGESMVNPLKYYDNNVNGTKVLLQSMVAHGLDKIVFSSTAATYGEPEKFPFLKQTEQNLPIHTVRPSLPWKRCLNGQIVPMDLSMFL